MMSVTTALLAGAGIGLSIAAPIGPTSMLCVQRTLALGLRAGLATGVGVATVHLFYGALAVYWGSAFAITPSGLTLPTLVSGLVLLGFSVRILRRVVVIDLEAHDGRTLASAYIGAVGCSFLNPITPVLFAAATPALLGHVSAPILLLVAGVFLGSLAWWCTLSASIALLRRRVTSPILNLANKAAGILLATQAVAMIARSY